MVEHPIYSAILHDTYNMYMLEGTSKIQHISNTLSQESADLADSAVKFWKIR